MEVESGWWRQKTASGSQKRASRSRKYRKRVVGGPKTSNKGLKMGSGVRKQAVSPKNEQCGVTIMHCRCVSLVVYKMSKNEKSMKLQKKYPVWGITCRRRGHLKN